MLSIIETEKRIDIKKFFIKLLKDFFQSGKSKHHMYSDSVIDTLLSGFVVYLSLEESPQFTNVVDGSNFLIWLQIISKIFNTSQFTALFHLPEESIIDQCSFLLYANKFNSAGLSGPDTETTTISLDLLLLIAGDEAGVQAIFKSANSFSYLVNRVILETEDR